VAIAVGKAPSGGALNSIVAGIATPGAADASDRTRPKAYLGITLAPQSRPCLYLSRLWSEMSIS